METAALTAALLSGERVVAPFDRPFLAGSLRHFWRRWNVVAGLKFRHTLHDPICAAGQRQQTQQKQHESDGAPAARRPSPARRMLGVCAVMTASGAVHELALWYLTRRFSGENALLWGFTELPCHGCLPAKLPAALPPLPATCIAGWWMLFFSVQGPLLIAEAWLRTLARQAGIRMPRPLGTAATLLLMHTRECRHLCMVQHAAPDVLTCVPASLPCLQWPGCCSTLIWRPPACPLACCSSCGRRRWAAASAARSAMPDFANNSFVCCSLACDGQATATLVVKKLGSTGHALRR